MNEQAFQSCVPDDRSMNCRYSFDDLHRAACGRSMSQAEKSALYALPQSDRNQWVRAQVARTGGRFACEDRIGDDGTIYTAFWAVQPRSIP
jgi:hypothetical protein